MRYSRIALFLLIASINLVNAQNLPPVWEQSSASQYDHRTRAYITPSRIVWKYDGNGKLIKGAENLLKPGSGQARLDDAATCLMKSTENEHPAILLDFGKELQGGIQIVTHTNVTKGEKGTCRVRIRYGESVQETMSTVSEKDGDAKNDHAVRDFIADIPWLGVNEFGNSGFRFVRIDLIDDNASLELKEVRAIFNYRDIPYLGSFRCNDERLNQIWMTGAYTVHLNMQEYLWDGIKRDRLVWIGDMHPETSTIGAVFGYNEVVPRSLDLARDNTPLPHFMNGIDTYSIWWLIIHRDWYMQNGNLSYLKEQHEYMGGLLRMLMTKIQPNGDVNYGNDGFLDWPSSPNKTGVHAGVHALTIWAMEAGAEIAGWLKDEALKQECQEAEKKLRTFVPAHNHLKQGAALMAVVENMDPIAANRDIISVGGAKGFSTFYGYYMLQAMSKAADCENALKIIKDYWGAMLDLGATTFWEDFDIEWMANAGRIDELLPAGKTDVHASYGGYCYKGYRHSFCHGWASGPTAWMSHTVLGVEILEPGCTKVRINPRLGNLQWVEGTYPTPHGIIKIRHDKQADGTIKSKIEAPKGVKIIR